MNIFDKTNYLPYSNFLLPVGISFYTFQTLSYTIDIYNNKIKAEKNFIIFALYVSFFPQLVAGPIERSAHLIPQLKKSFLYSKVKFHDSFSLILFGFFKKVVIADNLSIFVNSIYNKPYEADSISLIIATILFSFQIFSDFSGYSDIAIGVAKLFGIDLMQNFDIPYSAESFQEFWKKWHISLSRWFRDYVYIPLGGSKKGLKKHIINLIITIIVSGIWHGANWTFFVWGLLHGIYLITELFLQ